MKTLLRLLPLLVAAPAFALTDTVITKEKHTDAIAAMNQPAKDTLEVTWIGKDKDRARIEEGNRVTIVRGDLKKMYMLDTAAKTYSTLDLPFDIKKSMPPEMATRMEEVFGQMKVTVTPTEETKQVGEWNATRYTVDVAMPMGPTSTQEMWVTKDIGVDQAAWHELYAAVMSASPVEAGMATEMKKVDGFPVLIEQTRKIMNNEIKSTEKVISVEQKEPAADFYDAPKDYTEKPFDPMAGMMGPGRGKRGG